MKVVHCKQGSPEWLKARVGIPTASEFGNLVTPSWKIRTGEMPASYLASKIAEVWLGGPLPSFGGGAAEQGSIREEEAIPWFELSHGVTLDRPGFVTTDDGRLGCSPDAMCGDKYGLEVKCPMPQTHVKWLLGGKIPDEHVAQVYGSLYVTGIPEWKFLSYCRGFPPLVLCAGAYQIAMEAIGSATNDFLRRYDAAMARMKELDR